MTKSLTFVISSRKLLKRGNASLLYVCKNHRYFQYKSNYNAYKTIAQLFCITQCNTTSFRNNVSPKLLIQLIVFFHYIFSLSNTGSKLNKFFSFNNITSQAHINQVHFFKPCKDLRVWFHISVNIFTTLFIA